MYDVYNILKQPTPNSCIIIIRGVKWKGGISAPHNVSPLSLCVYLYACILYTYQVYGHTDTLYVCIPTRYKGHTLCVYTYQI